MFFFLSFIYGIFWHFWQPIGALLLEQCRVEKEDGQSFSVGELQHPGFPLLCPLLQKTTFHRQAVIILVIALCLEEILCFCSKHFWTKQRGNISLNVTPRSSVWSGWMPLSRPGSTFSLPFYKKKVYSGVHGAYFQSQGHLLMQHVIPLYSHHSYEFMRKKLIFYRTEIHRLTGKVRLILVELVRLKQLVGR